MFSLIKKKLNLYCVFAVLCALITLLPVLKYSLSTPKDLVLTVTVWLLSNLVVCILLFCYSRMDKLIKRFMVRKSNTQAHETHIIRQPTSESALQR